MKVGILNQRKVSIFTLPFLKASISYAPCVVETFLPATGSSECVQICTGVPTRRCTRRSSLQAHTGRCSFCTTGKFTFLSSPSSKLPFHMHLALVQPFYRANGSSECVQISTGGPSRRCMRRSGFCSLEQEGGLFPPTQGFHF